MKTRSLQNYDASVGVEVYDIDWNCEEELLELGRLCASQCIVFLNENLSVEKLFDVMGKWGDPSRAFTHEYICDKKLTGRHWREILTNLGYISNAAGDYLSQSVAYVSYKQGEKGRPAGMFQNGELNWHCDQCALEDGQRVIGLKSVSDTENSQTQFLCTHDAYESLSSDMQSMVKELVVKNKWFDNAMAPVLNDIQANLLRYNMVPLDGMETSLYTETASGLPGMKIPNCSFDGFVGMSREESDRVMDEIKKTVLQDKYVYTQNWNDGQVVFMDQEITLHKRPTNIESGNKRTMARSIFYVNKLYDSPKSKKVEKVRYNGSFHDMGDFIALVDEDRKQRYYATTN
jgi:alpha-ketoglutarate-dependent taurine dioxygenase